jgi:hypothetical protein
MSELLRGLQFAAIAWLFVVFSLVIFIACSRDPALLFKMPFVVIGPAVLIVLWKRLSKECL